MEPISTHTPIILDHVQYKDILDVSISFQPNTLTAIMGPSGSGKTTMLNILSGRLKPTMGNIVMNNYDKMGYVMQRDMLTETDTVKESLLFAIEMYGNSSMTNEDKDSKVETIINDLGLQDVKDSIIGSFKENGRGISGGEKKRVSIAQILVSDPDILLLDEPTSGLDSITAEHVMKTLIDIAHKGMIVICTIHQPSSELFQMFDYLVLLTRGNVAYSGKQSEALEYFANKGHNCPIYNNPADYYIHIITMNDISNNSDIIHHNSNSNSNSNSRHTYTNQIGYIKQLMLHIRRLSRKVIRDPYTVRYRVFQSIVIALIYGSLFWRLDSTRSKLGAIFYMVLYQGVIFSYMTSISSFPPEVGIVMREQLSYPYDMIPYMIAKTLVELPLTILYASIFLLITNFMIGINDTANSFFKFLFISILLSLVGQTWGYVSPSLFHSLEVINAVTPIMTPFIIMGGYFTVNVPTGALWLYNISFIRWAFQSMVEASIGVGNCTDVHKDEDIACNILNEYKIKEGTFWRATLILISEFIILRMIVIIALYYRKMKRNQSQE